MEEEARLSCSSELCGHNNGEKTSKQMESRKDETGEMGRDHAEEALVAVRTLARLCSKCTGTTNGTCRAVMI